MSSHSGTIGRKRGGSSGGSEYYFGIGSVGGSGGVGGGEQMIRRQRSAEWHSRHGYSSSEDEYQNTGQTAFDTQLLATLLLQSQQLANMDRYNSDADNEEVTTSLLTEYPKTNRHQHNEAALYQQPHKHRQQQITSLCSPHKQPTAAFSSASATNLATATTTANSKYQLNGNGSAAAAAVITSASRSTNPFLSSKYDSPQSNSDSLSERLSYSGSAAMLDRLQIAAAAAELSASNSSGAYLVPNSAAGAATLGVSASTTASSLQNQIGREHSLRASRSKSGRLSRTSGMTSSSSGTSSNSNAAVGSSATAAVASAMAAALANRSEREKLKLQQIQMELREYAQSDNGATTVALPTAVALTSSSVKFDDDFGEGSGGESEPPPDPAPPEIPPRTQSLLMSLRKSTDFKLKYEEKGADQKHEEFIPTSQLQQMQQQQQLQRDYLNADNSRSTESQSKSIASSDSPSQQGKHILCLPPQTAKKNAISAQTKNTFRQINKSIATATQIH